MSVLQVKGPLLASPLMGLLQFNKGKGRRECKISSGITLLFVVELVIYLVASNLLALATQLETFDSLSIEEPLVRCLS